MATNNAVDLPTASSFTQPTSEQPAAAKGAMLGVAIDFSKPDAQRSRPIVAEGKRAYVCEHYLSVWSPVMRQFFAECATRELVLPNVKFADLLELLECISPLHKEVTEQNIHTLLPLGFDYQCYLLTTTLSLLELLWLADRYDLPRLLNHCVRQLRPHCKLDISSAKYYSLSDKVKVQLLERLHGAPAAEEIAEPPPLDGDQFVRPSESNFALIRGKTGRPFYVNPHYVAAWSNAVHDRFTSAHVSEFGCGATFDELAAFLLAIHPPQLRITEQNIGPVLMAACKLEAPGLVRRCSAFILGPTTQLSTFARLCLLDRCFLHELLEVCLRAVQRPEDAVDMALQHSYQCLSTKARACILDRLAALLRHPGMQPHRCDRCQARLACAAVRWLCPQCGAQSAAADSKH